MTTNYEAAWALATSAEQLVDEGRPPNPNELRQHAAQVRATLAVADELRAIKELLVEVVGYAGTPGRAFVRVFDEAPS